MPLSHESLEARICLAVDPFQLLPDGFGPQQTGEWTLAASADYRVIGVPQANGGGTFDTGFAAVYDSANNLITSIPNPDPGANDEFGKAVGVSGSLLAVSAQFNDVAGIQSAGSVYIFDVASPTPAVPILTIDNPNPIEFEGFGNALGIDGNTLVVGAMRSDGVASDEGSVMVFDLASSTPSVPQVSIPNPAPATNDWFGWSVAVEGQSVVVGSLLDDATAADSGSAHVFDLSSATPTVPLLTLDHPQPSQAHQFSGALAISNGLVLVGSRLDSVDGISRAGAVHLYDLNGSTPQTVSLTIENPHPREGVQFGYALDLDGQKAVIGAWLDTPAAVPTAGSAYVYDLSSATPTEPAVTLLEPSPQPIEEFGYSVAINGDTVVATSRFDNVSTDYAFVYDLASATPESSIQTLENAIPGSQDRFGFAVSVDRNLMAVGAPLEDDAVLDGGAVYVYDLSTGSPVFVTRLFSPSPASADQFGVSVSVSGSRIAVGATRDDTGAANSGSVFVFDMASGTPDVPVFSIHNPTAAIDDAFGNAVDLDGDDLAVAAAADDIAAEDSGSVYLFDLSSATPTAPWLQMQHPGSLQNARFGSSLAVDEKRLVVGASNVEGAFVYDLLSATPQVPWVALLDPTPSSVGAFGFDVALDGDRVIVGAPVDDGRFGAAYVYDLAAATPEVAVFELDRAGPNVDDLFGFDVAVSGDQVLVGAPFEDTGAINAGRVYLYDLSSVDPEMPVDSMGRASPTDGLAFGDSLDISEGVTLLGASVDGTVNFEQGAAYAYVENTVPTIEDQAYTVAEDDDGSQSFATVQAFDAESSITYSIDGGSGQSQFSIDQQTGALFSTGTLDFETTASFELEISVTDQFGALSSATVMVDITDVNEPPIALDADFSQPPLGSPASEDAVVDQQLGVDIPLSQFATDVDTPLTTESFSFDSAAVTIDGATSTFTTLSEVGISYDSLTGQFMMDPTGIVLFQSLSDGESALVEIGFTVSDGELSDTGTVTFEVFGVNDAPELTDDSETTNQNTPIATIDVLLNDTDVEGDQLTITEIDSQPITESTPITLTSGAVVSLNGDGTLAYDPNGAFDLNTTPMDDLFTYTVSDGLLTSTAEVTISITIENEAPVANPDLGATDEDTVLTVASLGLLSNDTDADTHDIVGSTVLVTSHDSTSALGATVVVAADGGYSYDPTLATMIQALDLNGTVEDTFSYTITDSQGESSTSLVTITLTGVNDDPLAVEDLLVTDEDTPLVLDVLANDTDPDASAVLTVTETTQGSNGTVVIMDNQVEYTPAPDFNGSDSFTYTISDEHGATSVATVNVTVNEINDPPVALDADFSQPPLGSPASEDAVVDQQLGVDIPLSQFATDVDTPLTTESFSFDSAAVTIGGATSTFTALSEVGISYDSLTGQFIMDPTGIVLFQSLSDGESALVEIGFTVSDGELSDTGTVTFEVFGVNDAPELTDDSETTNQNTPIATIDVLLNDTDVEGDQLTITEIDSQPITESTPITLASGAVVSLNVDGTLAYDPNGAFDLNTTPMDDLFTYTVSDGLLTSTAEVTISITIENEAPVANPDLGATDEDTVLTVASLGLLSNDTDADTHDIVGSTVLVTSHDSTSALGATVVVAADGGYSYDPTLATMIQALDLNGTVEDTFSYTITDSQGESSTSLVTITLTGVNDDPLAADDLLVTDEDTPLVLNVLANDTDPDVSAVLTVTETTQGSNGTVVIMDNQVEYTPAPDFNGSDSFTYTISDEHGATSVATVNVTVNEVNDPPVALDDTGESQNAVQISVLDNDVSGPANEIGQMLTVVATSDPANGTVVINPDGTLTYTPVHGFTGTDSFTYTVEDDGFSDGLLDPMSATATVVVTINAVALPGDFNDDSILDCLDINLLSSAIVASSTDLNFDLTDDDVIDYDDLLEWLVIAGAENLSSGAPYQLGDANLDGFVGGADYLIWNSNKFTPSDAYCSGDFNADGDISGEDYLIWNQFKFIPGPGDASSNGVGTDERAVIGLVDDVSNRSVVQSSPTATIAWSPAGNEWDVRRYSEDPIDAVDFVMGLLAIADGPAEASLRNRFTAF